MADLFADERQWCRANFSLRTSNDAANEDASQVLSYCSFEMKFLSPFQIWLSDKLIKKFISSLSQSIFILPQEKAK